MVVRQTFQAEAGLVPALDAEPDRGHGLHGA